MHSYGVELVNRAGGMVAWVAWYRVGDSRCYVSSDYGRIVYRTEDAARRQAYDAWLENALVELDGVAVMPAQLELPLSL